jgi:acetyltransferase-like isoleucine patch superfamily enzyme
MKLHLFVILMTIVSIVRAQEESNFQAITIQGQFQEGSLDESPILLTLLSITGDTLWHEKHEGLDYSPSSTFELNFGLGERLSGEIEEFSLINWFDANFIHLSQFNEGVLSVKGEYLIWSMVYAEHSDKVLQTLSMADLLDVDFGDLVAGEIFYASGINFKDNFIGFMDSTDYANYSENTSFADTVLIAFHFKSDSANYAQIADNVLYNYESSFAVYSDSTKYSDTVGTVFFSEGNWGVYGNSAITEANFLGPIVDHDLSLRTNNNTRVYLGERGFRDEISKSGLNLLTNNGVLFQGSDDIGLTEIEGVHAYYQGLTHSFSGGLNPYSLDTSLANNCLLWGDSISTSGQNTVLFGKNISADSVINGASIYAAFSSFSIGKNNQVGRICFAFGDSAIASYYRNIAIGKNVVSSNNACVAIGTNVLSNGAIAWTAGKNLSATGNFSTALGTNASTNELNGCFIYGDNSTTDTVFNTAINQFMVRADGGYKFYSSADLTMGVELLPGGGSWEMISDRTKKE